MLLSIIVPVHNVEKYLEECLHSLVHQTYQNIEIIIIENDSTDNSPSIALQWQKKYPELIQYFSQKGGGLGGARNTGIQKAQGEYITFVDSDDYIPFNACQVFVNKALETDADIIAGTRTDYIEDNSNIKRIYLSQPRIKHGFLSIRTAHSKIFKTCFLKQNNLVFPTDIIWEDLSFYLDCSFFTQKIEYVRNPVYYYRINESSITYIKWLDHPEKVVQAHVLAFQMFKKKLENPSYKDLCYQNNMSPLLWERWGLKIILSNLIFAIERNSFSKAKTKYFRKYLYHKLKKSMPKKYRFYISWLYFLYYSTGILAPARNFKLMKAVIERFKNI